MSITLTIDGKSCTCEPGEYLATVAARNDIDIPLLCGSNAALLGRGSCRICVVEVVESGRKKVVASCIYPVTKSCEVFTKSERILKERAIILTLLRRLAPDSEVIAEMAEAYQAPDPELLIIPDDASKCILCGLCVEACKSLGANSISTVGRGVDKKISTPYGEASPVCIGCASCASVCPTNSIPVSDTEGMRTIWGRDFTIVYCEECDEELGTEESLAYAEELVGKSLSKNGEHIQSEHRALCSKHRLQQTTHGFTDIAQT